MCWFHLSAGAHFNPQYEVKTGMINNSFQIPRAHTSRLGVDAVGPRINYKKDMENQCFILDKLSFS